MRANQIPRRAARCRIEAFRADAFVAAGRDAKSVERPIVYCVTDAVACHVISTHVASEESRTLVEANLRRIYGETPIRFH
ncbi:MAG: hypothetical protein EPN55_00560 [Gammaproteobacteria bacterium]|nr:MAG: hypothetical protein EPN55_00560 [Gammaproteobacteria bacterium]